MKFKETSKKKTYKAFWKGTRATGVRRRGTFERGQETTRAPKGNSQIGYGTAF